MTLTSILPTLRASIPDPITKSCWPEATAATVKDVVVAGVSLTHLVALCSTPCVHVAHAAGPRSGVVGAMGTVVVTTVTAVCAVGPGRVVVELDADIDPNRALWSQARLIARASTAHPVRATVRASEDALTVPADLRAGDMLAIPCRGQLALRDVRRDVRPVTDRGAVRACGVPA